MKYNPKEVADFEKIADKWKAGERWISVNEYPQLAGYKDIARLFAAGQPVPGAAMDKMPEELKGHMEKYNAKTLSHDAPFADGCGRLASFYDDAQPRVPAGNPDGGQWVDDNSGGTAGASWAAPVRNFLAKTGTPTPAETSALANHLSSLTVEQLHGLRADHGIQASASSKRFLVAKLREKFQEARAKNIPAAKPAESTPPAAKGWGGRPKDEYVNEWMERGREWAEKQQRDLNRPHALEDHRGRLAEPTAAKPAEAPRTPPNWSQHPLDVAEREIRRLEGQVSRMPGGPQREEKVRQLETMRAEKDKISPAAAKPVPMPPAAQATAYDPNARAKLDGSAKQAHYAASVRESIIPSAERYVAKREAEGHPDAKDDREALEHLKREGSSRFWIDNRNSGLRVIFGQMHQRNAPFSADVDDSRGRLVAV
jgi:hypothetical protein